MTGAYVGSLEAVRDFRAALHSFAAEARDALVTYDLELRRASDWLTETKAADWKLEIRKADDAILQAKIELQRCRSTPLPGGGEPGCREEQKTLQRARRRHEHAAEKAEAVRRWSYLAEREASQYKGRAQQLTALLDVEMPRASALLDRVLTLLESYVAHDRPPGESATNQSATSPPLATVARSEPAETSQPPGDETSSTEPTQPPPAG